MEDGLPVDKKHVQALGCATRANSESKDRDSACLEAEERMSLEVAKP